MQIVAMRASNNNVNAGVFLSTFILNIWLVHLLQHVPPAEY